MSDDIINLWEETDNPLQNRINIVKTWLCDGSGGQTYPINDKVFEVDFDRIDKDKFNENTFNCEEQFDEIVGFKHDYKVDDPKLNEVAVRIVRGLDKLTEDIYAHPEKYFTKADVINGSVCHAREGISCDYAVHNDEWNCDVCTCEGNCPFKS